MRMSHRKTAMVIAVLTSLVLGAGVAVGAPPSSQRAQGSGWDGDGLHDAWRLIRSEKFNRPMRAGNDTGWFPNKDEKGTGYDVDAYDNDGEFFQTFGGDAFREHLAGLGLYRRSYTVGKKGWLTVELAARDRDGDGRPDNVPSFRRTRSRALGSVGTFNVPDHNSAVVLRSTDPSARGVPHRGHIACHRFRRPAQRNLGL